MLTEAQIRALPDFELELVAYVMADIYDVIYEGDSVTISGTTYTKGSVVPWYIVPDIGEQRRIKRKNVDPWSTSPFDPPVLCDSRSVGSDPQNMVSALGGTWSGTDSKRTNVENAAVEWAYPGN